MNELATISPLDKILSMWADKAQLDTIKKIYAPKLSPEEFQVFVQMGIACQLNPFLKEIWAVKYDERSAAQIFIGRDGYRKVISRNEDYRGHHVDAVYSNDDFCFDLTKGEVRHAYNLKDRGKLLGAYCLVHMKNTDRPYYVFVAFEEYNTNQSIWKTKPATMIKKVAECQAIRMADSSVSGTYDEDEMGDYKNTRNVNKNDASDNINELILAKKNIVDVDVEVSLDEDIINTETGEVTPIASSGKINPIILKKQIENAKSLDTLHIAADLIKDVAEDKQSELKQLYEERKEEFVK